MAACFLLFLHLFGLNVETGCLSFIYCCCKKYILTKATLKRKGLYSLHLKVIEHHFRKQMWQELKNSKLFLHSIIDNNELNYTCWHLDTIIQGTASPIVSESPHLSIISLQHRHTHNSN